MAAAPRTVQMLGNGVWLIDVSYARSTHNTCSLHACGRLPQVCFVLSARCAWSSASSAHAVGWQFNLWQPAACQCGFEFANLEGNHSLRRPVVALCSYTITHKSLHGTCHCTCDGEMALLLWLEWEHDD
jgi:hypothetical protein